MTFTSDPNAQSHPVLVLFDRTTTGRQRASWFGADDANDAEQAARPIGYTILRVADAGAQQLVAAELPRGHLLPDRGASVPYVKRERLERVLSALAPEFAQGTGHTPESPTGDTTAHNRPHTTLPVPVDASPDPVPSGPSDWDEIRPGSIVLVRDQHDEAWYEAVVLNVVGDVCRLKWRDYPGYPVLTRQRHQLGLMYPDGATKTAA